MNNNRRGMVWIEVLVAIGAMALINLLGMKTLGLFLERLMLRQATELETMEILGLGERIQRMYDQRRANPFVVETSMILEGESVVETIYLDRMQLRTMNATGKTINWELKTFAGKWVEQISPEAGPVEYPVRYLNYYGEIRISPIVPLDGNFPSFQRWTFPGCKSRQGQEGFAIYRFW